MASIELKEVPASAWAAVGWLGPQVAVIDEQFRIGFWDGTKYALGGGGGGGGGEAVWGDITGTLSAQADLQAVLDAKVASSAKASQSDAEGGSDNNSWMTPLRTAQAIDAQVLAPAWGEITGTLSVQADLQTALNAKLAVGLLASQGEAEAGSDNAKWMSPLRVAQAVAAQHAADSWGEITGTLADQADLQAALDARVAVAAKATQAEAEAGSNNTQWMSPLRVAQAIDALTSRGFRGYGTIATRNALNPAPSVGDIYVTNDAVAPAGYAGDRDIYWRYDGTAWTVLQGVAVVFQNRGLLGHSAGGWAAQNVEAIQPGCDLLLPAGLLANDGDRFTIAVAMYKAGAASLEAVEWRMRFGADANGLLNPEIRSTLTLDHNGGAGTQARQVHQFWTYMRRSATTMTLVGRTLANSSTNPFGSVNSSLETQTPDPVDFTVPNLGTTASRLSLTLKQITDATTDEWWIVTGLRLILEQ